MVFQGIKILSEGQDPKADIIFVHGLRGDAEETWNKGSVCWPRDMLPVDLPNVRIMTWGYDSTVASLQSFTSQLTIFGHLENLLGDLSRQRRDADKMSRPVIFVGHSLGGLVIKQALIRSAEMLYSKQDERRGAIYASTKGIVFLGTPHQGSADADAASHAVTIMKVIRLQPNVKLVDNLKQDSEVLESQRRSFASISENIPLVCIYEEFPTMGGLVSHFAVLDVQMSALFERDDRSMKGLLIVPERSACIPGFKVKTASIPANHMEMCKFEDANNIGYQRILDFLLDFLENAVPKQREIQKAEQKLLDSLYFSQIDHRHDEIAEPYKQTFQWIWALPGPGFVKWLNEARGIFWISGKAGSGKSTLMRYIVDDERTQEHLCCDRDPATICLASFFFHGRGTALQKSLEGLLRSITLQILGHFPQLITEVQRNFRRPRYRISSSSNKMTSTDDAWSMRDLERALRIISHQQNIDGEVCLFIDGLDEYDGDCDRITEMFKEMVDSSARSSLRFMLCVASRRLRVFEEHFRNDLSLQVQDLTASDIRHYVNSMLGACRELSDRSPLEEEEFQKLTESIISKACGVFLWVKLVVESLRLGAGNGDRIQELQSRLQETSSDLEDFYFDMIKSIERQDYRWQASTYLEIIEHAPRLTLLGFAFADEGPEKALELKHSQMTSQAKVSKCGQMESRLKSRCKGLVEIQTASEHREGTADSSSPRPMTTHPSSSVQDRYVGSFVQLLHQSVKDFLDLQEPWDILNHGRKSAPDIALCLMASFLSLFKTCGLTCFDEYEDWVRGSRNDATVSIIEIFECSILCREDSTKCQVRLLDSLDLVMNQKRLEHPRKEEPTPWFYDVIESRMYEITQGDPCNWEPTWDTNFVCVATYFGLEQYLTSKLKSEERLANRPSGRPLLCYAINCGDLSRDGTITIPNRAIISLLISHGADIHRVHDGRTPWHLALAIACRECGGFENLHNHDFIDDGIKENWLGLFHDLLDYGADPYVRIGYYSPFCPSEVGGNLGHSLLVLARIFRNQMRAEEAQMLLYRVRAKSNISEKEERQLARLKPEDEMTMDELRRRDEEEAFDDSEVAVEEYGSYLGLGSTYKVRAMSEDSDSHREFREILTEEYKLREEKGFLMDTEDHDYERAWEAKKQELLDKHAN